MVVFVLPISVPKRQYHCCNSIGRHQDRGSRREHSLPAASLARSLHALLLVHGQRAVDVIHLQGKALPAEPLLYGTRRNGCRLRITHHLDGTPTKLKAHAIVWPGRGFWNTHALEFAEPEYACIEGDRALRRRGEQFD